MHTITANHILDVKEKLKDYDDFTFSIDFNGNPILLIEKKIDNYYRHEVLHYLRGGPIYFQVPEVSDWYSFAQPIDDNWLLVNARNDFYTNNATIYDRSGNVIRSFALGDAVQDIQTTSNSKIWVSYFDQSDGGELNCFDRNGSLNFDFVDFVIDNNRELPFITDCYAMNVTSHYTSVYYYYEFPLVRLKENGEYEIYHDIPIKGSHAFAINDSEVLFANDYDRKPEVYLFSLLDRKLKKYTIQDKMGNIINYEYAIGRGNKLFLVKNTNMYVVDITEFSCK
ncbi:hypothetical protein [Fictibacillus barbaricus]|uniref:Uncharacterized protein n=1 Tax=Fictibacillus barbaricus TaxID=182136 RepID=A0ABS2ZH76_9BACL|nr:hypothetical protein [Fictibacillus barbaricus]MBN3546684.1 hypothetical protein [Fictibacillus barbaricus]GGB42969.1 hypothetical protein GCM10007199_05360 [Fictibacillus barbaricus]